MSVQPEVRLRQPCPKQDAQDDALDVRRRIGRAPDVDHLEAIGHLVDAVAVELTQVGRMSLLLNLPAVPLVGVVRVEVPARIVAQALFALPPLPEEGLARADDGIAQAGRPDGDDTGASVTGDKEAIRIAAQGPGVGRDPRQEVIAGVSDRVLELRRRVGREVARRWHDDDGWGEPQLVCCEREEDVLRLSWDWDGWRREQDDHRTERYASQSGRLVLVVGSFRRSWGRSTPRWTEDGERVAWSVGDGSAARIQRRAVSWFEIRRSSAGWRVGAGTNVTISSLLRETITSRMHHWRPSRAASEMQSALHRSSRTPSVRLRAVCGGLAASEGGQFRAAMTLAGRRSRPRPDERRLSRKNGLRADGGGSIWASWA
jgi:hypothetical protein